MAIIGLLVQRTSVSLLCKRSVLALDTARVKSSR